MRHGFRYSSSLVVSALLLCFGASSAAQQIRFENFSSKYPVQDLQQNGSAHLATYAGQSVLRLTDGGPGKQEASSVYFNVEQPLTSGFTTYFQFQMHNPTLGPNPGDGIAFIIQ